MLTLPMFTTTQTAHVVMVYTKTKGMYVAKAQHARSILRAHRRVVADMADIDVLASSPDNPPADRKGIHKMSASGWLLLHRLVTIVVG